MSEGVALDELCLSLEGGTVNGETFFSDNLNIAGNLTTTGELRADNGKRVYGCITGNSDGGTGKKYSDGTFDAWYKKSSSTTVNTSGNASHYRSNEYTLNIPSGIGASDIIFAKIDIVGSVAQKYVSVSGMTTSAIKGYIVSTSSWSSSNIPVIAHIHGTWS